jgi:hypothetical protein
MAEQGRGGRVEWTLGGTEGFVVLWLPITAAAGLLQQVGLYEGHRARSESSLELQWCNAPATRGLAGLKSTTTSLGVRLSAL